MKSEYHSIPWHLTVVHKWSGKNFPLLRKTCLTTWNSSIFTEKLIFRQHRSCSLFKIEQLFFWQGFVISAKNRSYRRKSILRFLLKINSSKISMKHVFWPIQELISSSNWTTLALTQCNISAKTSAKILGTTAPILLAIIQINRRFSLLSSFQILLRK